MTKHSTLRAAGLFAAIVGAGLLLSRRYLPVKVDGASMLPTLRPGDRLLVDRRIDVRSGDVVVARRPDGIEIVKRVGAVTDGSVWLEGDNPAASTDSRAFGPLPRDAVVGVVLACYGPIGRIRCGASFLGRTRSKHHHSPDAVTLRDSGR